MLPRCLQHPLCPAVRGHRRPAAAEGTRSGVQPRLCSDTGQFATQRHRHPPRRSALPRGRVLVLCCGGTPVAWPLLPLRSALHGSVLHSSLFLKELFKNLVPRQGLWGEHSPPGFSLLLSGHHRRRLCSGVIPWRSSCKIPVSSQPPVVVSHMPSLALSEVSTPLGPVVLSQGSAPLQMGSPASAASCAPSSARRTSSFGWPVRTTRKPSPP